jgi:hypothetical protein
MKALTEKIKEAFRASEEADEAVAYKYSDPTPAQKSLSTRRARQLKKVIEAEGLNFSNTLWQLANNKGW